MRFGEARIDQAAYVLTYQRTPCQEWRYAVMSDQGDEQGSKMTRDLRKDDRGEEMELK